LVGTVAITVATDHVTIPLLAVMAFGLGTGDTLFRTASLALVPRVVPDEHLEAAEGFHSAGETVAAQFVGPPVGGVLFAVAASLPFFIDSVSFGLSVLLLLSLPGTFRAERRQLDTAAHRSLIGEIGEGLRWLWAQPVLRTLALTLGVWNLVASGGEAVLVLFAADDLGVKGAGFGVLLATAALGSVIGGVVAGRISRRVRSGTLLRAAVLGGALAQLSFGFSPNVVFAGVLFAVVGFVGVVWNVVTIALRQRLVPDALMGRVNGAYRLVGIGTSPIGALAGGFLAHAVGVRWVFYAGGLALAMAGLVASPWLANGAFPTPEPSP
jgi:MFS family permease